MPTRLDYLNIIAGALRWNFTTVTEAQAARRGRGGPHEPEMVGLRIAVFPLQSLVCGARGLWRSSDGLKAYRLRRGRAAGPGVAAPKVFSGQ
jgi:hypothetical protein